MGAESVSYHAGRKRTQLGRDGVIWTLTTIRELFQNFRDSVDERRMPGGGGYFLRRADVFGLIFDGAIYPKIDDATDPDFEREGSKPFVYTRANRLERSGRASLNYWRLP